MWNEMQQGPLVRVELGKLWFMTSSLTPQLPGQFSAVSTIKEILFTVIVLRWRQKPQRRAALVASGFRTLTE